MPLDLCIIGTLIILIGLSYFKFLYKTIFLRKTNIFTKIEAIGSNDVEEHQCKVFIVCVQFNVRYFYWVKYSHPISITISYNNYSFPNIPHQQKSQVVVFIFFKIE